jgi:sugar phosphate isomerase/epimerase
VLASPDIVISTGAFRNLSLAEALSRIADLAPSAEICSWGPHSLLEPENARAVAAAGLPISVHGPFTHEGLGSPSKVERLAAIELHRHHMWASAELGATLYVLHPDLQPVRRPRDPRVAGALERSFEAIRLIRDELGLVVVVENMPFVGRSNFTAPGDLDLQGLDLALDVGHATIAGTLDVWLRRPRAPLRHLHLHDNLGFESHDSHQPLGTGVVDVAPAILAARAAGAKIVLEQTSEDDVISSLESLRANGFLSPLVG